MPRAPRRVVSTIGPREQAPRTAHLASIQPDTLVSVLTRAERGDTRDQCALLDRLLFFDGHIRANYETRIAMVAAAPWSIRPGAGTDSVRDAEAAAYVQEVLRALDCFEQAQADLLHAVGVGFSLLEIDWEHVDGTDRPIDLRWIHGRRLEWKNGWQPHLADAGDPALDHRPLSDWPDKFILHTPRAIGAHPGTAGCLRACVWPYLFRRWATQFWVRGAEKYAWPTMVGKVVRGATDDVRAVMKSALRDAASDHYLVTEVDQAVELLETTAKDGGTFAELDEALKAEISKAILGSTDQTEPVKVGAWKAVESRKGTTVDSRVALDSEQLARTLRAQLFAPMLRYGGYEGAAVPEIDRELSGTRVPVSEIVQWIDLVRGAGLQPTADSVRELAERTGLRLEEIPQGESAPRRLDLAPTDLAKVILASEARSSQGLPPFGDERDGETVAALGEPAIAPAQPPAT